MKLTRRFLCLRDGGEVLQGEIMLLQLRQDLGDSRTGLNLGELQFWIQLKRV